MKFRLPDTKHQWLKAFARARSIGLNKLVEEWAVVALAQIDTENRYLLWAARDRPEADLALLDKLDQSIRRRKPTKKN